MYRPNSQQQRPQSFSNGSRPHQQPHPNQQQQQNLNHAPSDLLSQVLGFQFPRPTQLPDELESALSIRASRDVDHRLIHQMNPQDQQQNQNLASGISQHGNYSSAGLTSDCHHGQQPVVDWSNYQPPSQMLAGPPTHDPCQQGSHQQPEALLAWAAAGRDSPSSQGQGSQGGRGRSCGESQGFYTPESAGSILASFGLSNEDLEVLSHYPDDQLTPDTLPFILRDIQVNKSGQQKPAATASSSFSHNTHDAPLLPSTQLVHSRSPDVPSLLAVTQTAGKVIDYGHASRSEEDSRTRETFKREPLSTERTVKMYQVSSAPPPKTAKTKRRVDHLEASEPSKHGDRDYRRSNKDHQKSDPLPGRESPPSTKSRRMDRDYRQDRPKSRPTSETRSEDSSRQSPASKPGHNSGEKFPNPTMISDFSAAPPKVFPHTCSLCHVQCDQEKDWINHINTVNHTAACRDLRNKYPAWRPDSTLRRSRQYGSQSHQDSRDFSPSRSHSQSLHLKHRPRGPQTHGPHRRPYSPSRLHRSHQHSEHGTRPPSHRFGSHSPSVSHGRSGFYRDHGASSGGTSRSDLKRPHSATSDSRPHPSKISTRGRSGAKITKSVNTKKKKLPTLTSQTSPGVDCLVYLTGIPNDASEQEVTNLVGSFGKINNVILLPCSEEEEGGVKNAGQKASVCMMKAEDAEELAKSTNLSIREQNICASAAVKPEEESESPEASGRRVDSGEEEASAVGQVGGPDAEQKDPEKNGLVLLSGLPERGWSESDIIEILQPFGMPSDIIMAPHIGKVLVFMSDLETAAEMVKVHSFLPAKIQTSELQTVQIKQNISLQTPVALYNLLMKGQNHLDGTDPVPWNSLLVITNVPPSCSSEVQKLVQRFGTVIKTLVVNNTVICEMATNAMALSVYKRFQTFPVIIQKNPLFFSRKPDPRPQTLAPVLTQGKISQSAAAAVTEEQPKQPQEEPQVPAEGTELGSTGTDEKVTAGDQRSEETIGTDDLVNDSAADVIAEEERDTSMDQAQAGTFTTSENVARCETREDAPEVKVLSEVKVTPEVKVLSEVKVTPEVKVPSEVKATPEVKVLSEVKATPEVKVLSEVKVTPEVKVLSEVKVTPEVKVPSEVKVTPEVKNASEVKITPEVKVRPEVKNVPEVKVTPEVKNVPEVKVTPEVKNVPEVKVTPEVKNVPEVKVTPDVKNTSEEKVTPELKVSPEVKIMSEVKNASEVKVNPELKVTSAVKDASEMKVTPEVKDKCELPEVPEETVENLSAEILANKNMTTFEQKEDKVQTETKPKQTSTETELKKKSTEKQDVNEKKSRDERKVKEVRAKDDRDRERSLTEERGRRERERRMGERRAQDRRMDVRKERDRRENKRPYAEGFSGSRSYRSEGRSCSRRQSSERKVLCNREEQKKEQEQEEEEDEEATAMFPFNLSDFVTVDEVGDVTDLPCSPSPVVTMETTDVPDIQDTDACVLQEDTKDHGAAEANPSSHQDTPVEAEPETAGTKTTLTSSPEPVKAESSDVSPAAAAAAPICSTSATPPSAPAHEAEGEAAEAETKLCPPSPPPSDPAPVVSANLASTTDAVPAPVVLAAVTEVNSVTPAAEAGSQDEQSQETVETTVQDQTPISPPSLLPPFDPMKAVGLEFLVPKTGFFCKPCNRFFSGGKVAETTHCRTLKHYENLQKYLETMKKTMTSKLSLAEPCP